VKRTLAQQITAFADRTLFLDRFGEAHPDGGHLGEAQGFTAAAALASSIETDYRGDGDLEDDLAPAMLWQVIADDLLGAYVHVTGEWYYLSPARLHSAPPQDEAPSGRTVFQDERAAWADPHVLTRLGLDVRYLEGGVMEVAVPEALHQGIHPATLYLTAHRQEVSGTMDSYLPGDELLGDEMLGGQGCRAALDLLLSDALTAAGGAPQPGDLPLTAVPRALTLLLRLAQVADTRDLGLPSPQVTLQAGGRLTLYWAQQDARPHLLITVPEQSDEPVLFSGTLDAHTAVSGSFMAFTPNVDLLAWLLG